MGLVGSIVMVDVLGNKMHDAYASVVGAIDLMCFNGFDTVKTDIKQATRKITIIAEYPQLVQRYMFYSKVFKS